MFQTNFVDLNEISIFCHVSVSFKIHLKKIW